MQPTPENDMERNGKKSRALHPVVWATAWVSFFTDAGSELIYPLLPIYLTTALGLSKEFVGLIEGVAESTASLLKLVSGNLSDRFRKRTPFVAGGYTLSSVSRPLLALVSTGPQALLLRFLDRVGKGFRSAPRDALVNDATDPALRGRAFGIQRAMDHGGAIVGSVGAFVLLRWLHLPLKTVIVLSAIPGVFVLATIALRVRDVPHAAEAKPIAPTARAALPGRLRVYLSVLALFALGNSSDAFLLLRAKQMGLTVPLIPLVWAALHVTKAAFSVWGGGLSDRVGRRRVIMMGWVVYAGVYAGFAFAGGAAAVWLLFVIYGVYFGFTEGVEKAFVADLVPKEAAGTAFGVFNLVVGLCALPSSLLMGAVWQRYGHEAAFLMGAGLAGAAAILFVALVREGKKA